MKLIDKYSTGELEVLQSQGPNYIDLAGAHWGIFW